MKIEVNGCDQTCPFYKEFVDYDCVGYDTMINCTIIQWQNRINKTNLDSSIACFDSYLLVEPIEQCDYCKELERKAEKTDVWEEKDSSKCTCEYENIEFKHPIDCPLRDGEIVINV